MSIEDCDDGSGRIPYPVIQMEHRPIAEVQDTSYWCPSDAKEDTPYAMDNVSKIAWLELHKKQLLDCTTSLRALVDSTGIEATRDEKMALHCSAALNFIDKRLEELKADEVARRLEEALAK